MATNRIFWDETEKLKVAKESFRILNEDPTLSHLEAIAKAQNKVLKSDRRRPIETVNFSKFRPWIEPMWHEIGTKKEKAGTAKAAMTELFTQPPAAQPAEPEATQPALETVAGTVQYEQAHAAVPPQNTTVVSAAPPPEAKGYKDFDIRKSGPALVKSPSLPVGEEPTRHMIRWVESEKMIVARGVARRMKPGGIERLDALRATVQLDLPEYRQRDITTWHQVEAWIEPMLKQAKNDMILEEIQEREAREQAERDEAARIEAAKLEEQRLALQEREREQEIERRVHVRVAALSFDALIRAFAKKMAGDMLTAMREELHNGMMDEVLDVLTRPTPAAAPPETLVPREVIEKVTPEVKLPKIMVVGLFPNQEADVERAFRGTIDFEFVKSQKMGGMGEGGHGMIARSLGCEVVLAMSDACGLDVEQKRKHLSMPFRRIAGSSSNLKRWLTAYLAGEIDLAGSYSEEGGK